LKIIKESDNCETKQRRKKVKMDKQIKELERYHDDQQTNLLQEYLFKMIRSKL